MGPAVPRIVVGNSAFVESVLFESEHSVCQMLEGHYRWMQFFWPDPHDPSSSPTKPGDFYINPTHVLKLALLRGVLTWRF